MYMYVYVHTYIYVGGWQDTICTITTVLSQTVINFCMFYTRCSTQTEHAHRSLLVNVYIHVPLAYDDVMLPRLLYDVHYVRMYNCEELFYANHNCSHINRWTVAVLKDKIWRVRRLSITEMSARKPLPTAIYNERSNYGICDSSSLYCFILCVCPNVCSDVENSLEENRNQMNWR